MQIRGEKEKDENVERKNPFSNSVCGGGGYPVCGHDFGGDVRSGALLKLCEFEINVGAMMV